MDSLLKEVDRELSLTEGPYFLGMELSLVDIMFVPFLERMAASLPYYKGFESRSERYPHLLKWYQAMDGRPAYQGIKSDYVTNRLWWCIHHYYYYYYLQYTHCQDLPPQIGGCISLPEADRYRVLIDGGDWTLEKTAEECFEPMIPIDPEVAIREAVRNVLSNRDAVVRWVSHLPLH